MAYEKEKFKNLVHYIAANCEDSRRLGAIKLNKILWYSDILAYQMYGQTITGSAYVKRQFGPVPKRILAALEELAHEGRLLTVDEQLLLGRKRREFISVAKPDVVGFSAKEIALVDQVIRWACYNHTAQSLSDLSHNAIWEMAEIGEEIPVKTVLVSNLGEVDENDMAWADTQFDKTKTAAATAQ